MVTDYTQCSVLFCDLAENCRRKDYVGKPHDPNQSFADFDLDLHFNDMQELVCDAQLIKTK